ncbi:putative uncharacterized protein [Sutterella wadsworthensis CAG:135]|nr:putative uncharacterized protein [Sutterella wadsworthensis CAG:135]
MPPVFGPLDPMTRHSAGLFLCKPQASGFFSISFLQITPVTMSIHIPHFCTVNNRLKPGLMPQSSAAYESARDWRSAGGLFGEILLRCRPANPLTALRRHPEALARIEAWPALKHRSAERTSMPGALRCSRPLRPTVRFGQMKRSAKASLPADWH